jgi:dTDP-4-dehydrorhamnose 3,5-epimerase
VPLTFVPTAIEGVVRIEIDPIRDDRGFFARAWSEDEFRAAGIGASWVQANMSRNPRAGTLRGLHYQREPDLEAKLVRCIRGRIRDVAVDMRPDSPTFRRWVAAELTAERGESMFIAPGCAHGYLTLEPDTDVYYQASARYAPASATGVRYDDPAFGIDWGAPIALVSEADRTWPLQAAE